MRRATLVVILGVLVAVSLWAAPSGTAHSALVNRRAAIKRTEVANSPDATLPMPVWFREVKERGLLIKVWINDRGPFTFAVDTGAGITITSEALANETGLRLTKGRSVVIAGLSGREITAQQAVIDRIALGERSNVMPATIRTLIAQDLPTGIDGILDPGDAYSPLGYSIDLPKGQMKGFDPKSDGLKGRQPPAEGVIVPWLRDNESNRQSNRPFVRLSDGRFALIDTGSNLGLAFSATLRGNARTGSSSDVGGGTIKSTRVGPSTVSIGALVLRGVPTDILANVEKGAPVILGRDALYPFRISFDPLHRLIEITPSVQDRE